MQAQERTESVLYMNIMAAQESRMVSGMNSAMGEPKAKRITMGGNQEISELEIGRASCRERV